jgi:hypothetical protein
MTNLGGIIDVALGMSFIYLLLSLVCSGANELLAWMLRLRAKSLRQGIETMLEDDALKELTGRMYLHPLIRAIAHKGAPSYIPSTSFVLALLDTLCDVNLDRTKLLDGLGAALGKLSPGVEGYAKLDKLKQDLTDKSSAGVWSFDGVQRALATLLDVVAQLPEGEGKQIVTSLLARRQNFDSLDGLRNLMATLPATSRLRRQLELFLDDGVKDVAAYRGRLETWFDQGMDRLSGAYKRRAQLISIMVGLAISFAVGVDSWVVGNALMHDGALRQATVAAAVEVSKSKPPVTTGSPVGALPGKTSECVDKTPECAAAKQMAAAIGGLDELKLPIGLPYLIKAAPAGETGQYWLWRVLGMIFTGLAVALGAPFWFDVVGKLINMRSSGPPPQKAEGKG